MAVGDVLLAVLDRGPAHGYDIKRTHDAWFADGRPMAYGQVYAALARLAEMDLVKVSSTEPGSGPQRTVYALTQAGRERLGHWFEEPARASLGTTPDIVRKTIAALRTGRDAIGFLERQRTAHLKAIRELQAPAADDADPGSRLAREHLIAHLDADLRWLDKAADRLAFQEPST